MPGYPTRKLLFGGPETRTEADTLSAILGVQSWLLKSTANQLETGENSGILPGTTDEVAGWC